MQITKNKKRIRTIRASEDVIVAPEASELLFEAEDVAELIAEVTEDAVAVDVSDDGSTIKFTVGDAEYTVEAEGDEEVLEAATRINRSRKPVKASANRKRPASTRKVTASTHRPRGLRK